MTTIFTRLSRIERSFVRRAHASPRFAFGPGAPAARLEGRADRPGDGRTIVQLDPGARVQAADDVAKDAEEQGPGAGEERARGDDVGLRPPELELSDQVRRHQPELATEGRHDVYRHGVAGGGGREERGADEGVGQLEALARHRVQ